MYLTVFGTGDRSITPNPAFGSLCDHASSSLSRITLLLPRLLALTSSRASSFSSHASDEGSNSSGG
jgi:hypothetical protein